ncbi:MAG: spondin domain-containing protein [Rudaea sp.]
MDQAAMLNAARADAPNAASGRHRGDDDLNAVMFMVRIENVSTGSTLHLSNGQTAPAPNSPGVWTVTRLFNPLFTVGQYDAGLGLEQQAEDGNPAVLGANIVNNPWVKSSGIFAIPVGDATPGPATPGKAFEFTVMASPGDRLSFTSMFGQSNDLFYSPGILGIPLFRGHGLPMSGDVTEYVKLWDAGTEVNQEPGLGPDQAPRQSAPNTGESEHKRILAPHDQWTYPATDQVIKVTITPMNANS